MPWTLKGEKNAMLCLRGSVTAWFSCPWRTHLCDWRTIFLHCTSRLPTAPVGRSCQVISLTQTSEEMKTFAGKVSLGIRRINRFTNLFYFLVCKHLRWIYSDHNITLNKIKCLEMSQTRFAPVLASRRKNTVSVVTYFKV